jgi:hypothetical protein
VVSISRGGASRYIIAWVHLSKPGCTINEHIRAVDVVGCMNAQRRSIATV